jgi:ketosteroid isomerase-like protein
MTTDASIGPSHPDAITYRRTAKAFRAGDFEELATTIHEHVIWHMPGTTWMARDLEGRIALVAYLQEITQRTHGTFTLRDVCISGSEDHVLAAQRFGATVHGEERSFDVTSVMRFTEGRQKERWFHIHNQSAFDEFFARFPSKPTTWVASPGHAVQADRDDVTGGQAALNSRATIVSAQIVRILDGLIPLRADADPDDLAARRTSVRSAVERLVDALVSADTVAGQLGALRDVFGLVEANVNTIEEEGVRTAFWTLVDLIADLQASWTDRPARRPPS